jgi:protein kinase-like protein/pentapeptide repeat protein
MDLTPFHGPPAAAPQVPGFVARTLLGFGTHGEVWSADDLTTGDQVALKIGRQVSAVPFGASVDPSTQHETALLCRIDHPHIVRLQRVVPLADGGLAMVLDLAAGGSLASLVAARGRLDPGEVSTLLVPLAAALDHLHRRGVVHGDLAPGNVLFTADGRPQLGDLGVARVLGTRTEAAWATPGFTDPALVVPDGDELDLRAADLWGLAAIGWFALTGRPPEPTGCAAPDQTAPAGASALGELLAQCLAPVPAQRPSLTEVADLAWQAARPVPVRLVNPQTASDAGAGLPPLSGRATRPVMAGMRLGDVDRDGAVGVGTDSGSAHLAGIDAGGAGGTDLAGTDLAGTALAGTDLVGTDLVGTDLVGTDLGGPEAVPGRAAPGTRGSDTERPAVGFSRAGEPMGGAELRPAGGAFAAEWLFSGGTAGRRGRAPALAVGAATVVAVGAVAAAGIATGVRSGAVGAEAESDSVRAASADRASPVAGSGIGSPIPAASLDGRSTPGASASAGLDAELTRALSRIGRARAMAFRRASAGFLAAADVTGSPAYQHDLELVQRLRVRGYRLEGVRYEVSAVRVLHRRGELVDVRALVTTSAHRQVRISSGAVVAVPADGPRPVVLTVAPVDGNRPGPERWRVRSIQVPS